MTWIIIKMHSPFNIRKREREHCVKHYTQTKEKKNRKKPISRLVVLKQVRTNFGLVYDSMIEHSVLLDLGSLIGQWPQT